MSIKQVQKAKPKRPRIVLVMEIDHLGCLSVTVTQGRSAARKWIRMNGEARFVIEAEHAAKDGGTQ